LVLELKRSGCMRCGFADTRALAFHHRDPGMKEFTISGQGRVVSEERFQAEIAKCDVLCANCHAIEHYDQQSVRLVTA
jgi:hypothetical protein